jgi:hypothetical protein
LFPSQIGPRGYLLCGFWVAVALIAPRAATADPAPFDLAGPVLQVAVTHAGKTLPIAATPTLAVGDQLSIKADLASDQSAPYLLVVAFLRGATNPAPMTWFSRLETWTPKGRVGLKVTVPEGAQQALIFLAPRTGGDFKTLVGAIRGRPGAFVRASQGLNQAFLDRSRLEAFLAAVRTNARRDPEQLATISPLLARSLAVKLNKGCLQKTPELQAACLSEGQDALVLDDGHDASMAQTLTSGEPSDLIQQLGATPKAGAGYHSPYIGAVMDIVRVFDSMHTAQYQYIPALTLAHGDKLSLMLNAAPSFHNPLSVLVAAMPAIENPGPPILAPVDAKAAYCAEKPNLVLPVDGAPLAFSTGFARNLVLRLKMAEGEHVDVPAQLDASRGGLLVDAAALADLHVLGAVDATLHGDWGFISFDGPQFHLQTAQPQHWTLAANDQASLIVGRDASVRLEASEAACAETVALRGRSGASQKLTWKRVGPRALAVTLPLKDAQPGPLTLLIQPFGDGPADTVTLQAYAQAGRLHAFALHSGDVSGVLTGARLDEVASLTLRKITFTPGPLTTSNGVDAMSLATQDKNALDQLKIGETLTAKVALKDGRNLDFKVTIEPPRPRAVLINTSATPAQASLENTIAMTDAHDIPAGSTLVFAIRAQTPAAFTADEKVEVAPIDGVGETLLTFANGLVLQDAHVALATLDTGKAFTASTFGPLHFRIFVNGVAGDWQPLATLVRLPAISDLRCPAEPNQSCQLTGSNLFLIDSVSTDPQFAHPIQVPEGLTDDVLTVPHPASGRLYVKLRDDPSAINLAALSDGANPKANTDQPTAVAAAASPANKSGPPSVAKSGP